MKGNFGGKFNRLWRSILEENLSKCAYRKKNWRLIMKANKQFQS